MLNEEMFDEFIEEPLLTEEGFLNEACMNALSKAIENMPKTHERLKGEPEWNTLEWVFLRDITAALAKWAIRQGPTACPLGLERVIGYLDACLSHTFEFDATGIAKLSLCDINKALYDILYEKGVTDFDKWNEGNDFIDLDALLHNVCVEIRDERRCNDTESKLIKKCEKFKGDSK